MSFPMSIVNILAEANRLHGDDIQLAVELAESEIRRLPDFKKEIEGMLITHAVQTLIHDSRHKFNRDLMGGIRSGNLPSLNGHASTNGHAGKNGQSMKGKHSVPKVIPSHSKEILADYSRYFAFKVAGKTLGAMLGSELELASIAAGMQAKGNLFVESLCNRLAKMVPDDKRVMDVVPGKTLEKIFLEEQAKRERVPA